MIELIEVIDMGHMIAVENAVWEKLAEKKKETGMSATQQVKLLVMNGEIKINVGKEAAI